MGIGADNLVANRGSARRRRLRGRHGALVELEPRPADEQRAFGRPLRHAAVARDQLVAQGLGRLVLRSRRGRRVPRLLDARERLGRRGAAIEHAQIGALAQGRDALVVAAHLGAHPSQDVEAPHLLEAVAQGGDDEGDELLGGVALQRHRLSLAPREHVGGVRAVALAHNPPHAHPRHARQDEQQDGRHRQRRRVPCGPAADERAERIAVHRHELTRAEALEVRGHLGRRGVAVVGGARHGLRDDGGEVGRHAGLHGRHGSRGARLHLRERIVTGRALVGR